MTTRRERLEAKIEKRQEWAEKRRAEASQRFTAVQKICEHIPPGQPILVGHHSERRARADQARIHNGMRAAVHADSVAGHHEQKAAGLARVLDTHIFSDDDDATERLRERIDKLRQDREKMKGSNAAYRKGPARWAAFLGVDAETEAKARAEIEAGYSWCRQPHPSYELQNIGANIRRLEQRLKDVAARSERAAAAEATAGGVMIEGGGWVRVTFAEKPRRELLNELRGAGFRWAGGSWQGRRDALPASVVALLDEGE